MICTLRRRELFEATRDLEPRIRCYTTALAISREAVGEVRA
ncbi:MAG: hypothetical protein AAF657_06920 [Acidobacteriota bacterium]